MEAITSAVLFYRYVPFSGIKWTESLLYLTFVTPEVTQKFGGAHTGFFDLLSTVAGNIPWETMGKFPGYPYFRVQAIKFQVKEFYQGFNQFLLCFGMYKAFVNFKFI